MKKQILFSQKIWTIISTALLFLTCCAVISMSIAEYYRKDINLYLGCKTYKLIETGDKDADTNYFPSDYLTSKGDYNDHALFNAALDIGEKIATEGTVLLKNENSALPLPGGATVHLFGISSAKYLYCGYGSGEITRVNGESLNAALDEKGVIVNDVLWDFYSKGKGSVYGRTNYTINEVPWALLDNMVLESVNDANSSAVVVLSRTDGEEVDLNGFDNDGIGNNYLQLSVEENDLLAGVVQLKALGRIKNIVLVLTAACAFQMDMISSYDEIDSIVWAGIGGTMATQALANVLVGDHNPSGRLVDTYLYDNYSAPAMENFGDYKFPNADSKYPKLSELTESNVYEKDNRYMVLQEGVYIGYRYFETRYSDLVTKRGNADSKKGIKAGKGSSWDYSTEVAYPFGFGLSYTQFDYSGFSVAENGSGYTVSLDVTNAGSEYSGRNVVQVYIQKPYTVYDEINKIEKPAVELAGFYKTKDLAPGQSETVTLTIEKEEFKVYDANAAKTYILEAGDYYLAAGENAHDALNNILTKQNYTEFNGMTYDGNAEMVERITVLEDDTDTFSRSAYTGKDILNRFDDADLNKYKGSGGQKVTYLSRNDWGATYPSTYVLECTDTMYEEILYEEGGTLPDSDNKSQEFGKNNNLTLIMMKDFEFKSDEWDDLLDQLTYNECLDIILKSSAFTPAVVSVASPEARSGDGPAGLVKRDIAYTYAYPSQVLMGATFDLEMVKELGECFGLELLHNGVTMIYAPGANIHRAAYSGRNWEYYSEDSYLSAVMLAAECEGITSKGGIVVAKHFALNDQETNRNGVCIFTNEQAIREVYLKCFEEGVASGKTNAVMSSFSRIGTIWAGAHSGLLTEVLREEWGFTGFVKTDALCSPYMTQYANAIVAGNDMWMGDTSYDAVTKFENNPDFLNAIKTSAHRILYTIMNSNAMNGISATTKVVKILAWWEILFIITIISFGILFIASVIMLFISKKRSKNVGAGALI